MFLCIYVTILHLYIYIYGNMYVYTYTVYIFHWDWYLVFEFYLCLCICLSSYRTGITRMVFSILLFQVSWKLPDILQSPNKYSNNYISCCCLVTKSYPTLCNPWTVAHQAPRPWNFPGKNTGVGCHFLLQEIFPTKTEPSTSCIGRLGSLPLSHQRSP